MKTWKHEKCNTNTPPKNLPKSPPSLQLYIEDRKMKVTYEFDTNSENYSSSEHEMFKQALNMCVALGKIQDLMRSWYKYDNYPICNEYSDFWEDLSEEKKQFYKEHKIPDIGRMTQEVYDCIDDSGVNMEKLGY